MAAKAAKRSELKPTVPGESKLVEAMPRFISTFPVRKVNLFPEVVACNPEKGGPILLSIGMSGGGKTGFLLHVIKRKFESKKKLKHTKKLDYHQTLAMKEKLFWIDDLDCQWARLPDNPVKKRILVARALYRKIKFFQEGQPLDMYEVPFDSFDELVKLADDSMLNVVYMPSSVEYLKLIMYLLNRITPDWISVFVDEVERLAPFHIHAGKEANRLIKTIASTMIRSRKQRTPLFFGCHNQSNIHWLIKKLINYYAFLPGAMAIDESRIIQEAIDVLELGQFRMSHGGRFDNPIKSFPNYPEKMMVRAKIDEEPPTK